MEPQNLSNEEQQYLKQFILTAEEGEKSQIIPLFASNLSRYKIAATHSEFVKDWERTKMRMEKNLESDTLPPNTSKLLYSLILKETEIIINHKLETIQLMFETQFGESIFNYLGKDGKKKSFFGMF
jgi:hypothetical protein